MTISVRVGSVADIDAIVRLNRDVQQLHAELEPSFFKSNFDNEEVAAFFAAKLPCQSTIFDWRKAATVQTATCGLKCKTVRRHH